MRTCRCWELALCWSFTHRWRCPRQLVPAPLPPLRRALPQGVVCLAYEVGASFSYLRAWALGLCHRMGCATGGEKARCRWQL